MSDDVILTDSNATITTTLAVVNNVSYPINTISSIFVRKNKPWPGLWVILIIVVLIELGTIGNHAYGAAVVVGALIALTIFLLMRKSYSLVVRSAGADTSVLTGKDLDYLNRIKAAIEEAVRRRG